MVHTEEMQWYPDYLLQIGMDGSNVNLKFQEDLKGKFDDTSNKTFLDIDIDYASSKKGNSKLPLDIDQFAVNCIVFLSYPVPGETITLNYKN